MFNYFVRARVGPRVILLGLGPAKVRAWHSVAPMVGWGLGSTRVGLGNFLHILQGVPIKTIP